MKGHFLLIIILFAFGALYAQKKKCVLEGDVFKADSMAVFKFSAVSNQYKGMYDYYLRDMNDSLVAEYKYAEFLEQQPNMPNVRVQYYHVTFLPDSSVTDVDWYAKPLKNAQKIYESGLMKEGLVDKDKKTEYILKNGLDYSRRRELANGDKEVHLDGVHR